MKLSFYIIPILFLQSYIFSTGNSFCQSSDFVKSEKIQSLIINAGIADFHIKDDYMAASIFNSVIFSSGMAYRVKSENSYHIVTLNYSTGKADSDEQPGETNHNIGSLSYIYMRRMFSYSPELQFALGGGVSTTVENTDLLLNSRQGGSYTDQAWYWSHAINIDALADYALNEKTSLSFHLALPVFSIVSRPKNGHWLNRQNSRVIYNSFLHAAEKGSGEFIWDNFSIACLLEYRQAIAPNLAFRGTYVFNYLSSDKPMSLGMYKNDFLIGVEFIL